MHKILYQYNGKRRILHMKKAKRNVHGLVTVLLLAVMLCSVFLSSLPALASEPDTAEEIITYEGLAARYKEEPGIRSLFRVDQAAVKALEAKGYTVAYGAMMGIGEKRGESRYTADNMKVKKTEAGFVNDTAEDSYVAAVTVYATKENGVRPDYATMRFLTYSATEATFAYTTVFSEGYQTADAYKGYGLVYCAFLALTKDGNTTITYTRAAGDVFGSADGEYGAATTLYELSDYFLNKYRENEEDTESVYYTARTLRRVMAVCGLDGENFTAANTDARTVAATDGYDKTIVLPTSVAGLSFTVDKALPGVYGLTLKAANKGQLNSVTIYVNNRAYTARMQSLSDKTAVSNDGAVASDAEMVDFKCFVTLDSGINKISVVSSSASAQNPLSVSAARLTLADEIEDTTVLLGAEDLKDADAQTVSRENTVNFGGKSVNNLLFMNFPNSGKSTIDANYTVTVPVAGKYRIGLMTALPDGRTLSIAAKNADGNTVATSAITATGLKYLDASRATLYTDALGTLILPAGELTLTLSSNFQMALADIFLFYQPETAESEPENPKTIFTANAADMTMGGGSALLSDGKTVKVPNKGTLTFTADIEVEGVYRLYGKTNRADTYIQYVSLSSDKQTAHALATRLGNGATEAKTNGDKDLTVAAENQNETYAVSDTLGFIYLTKGTHNFTFSVCPDGGEDVSIGVYNLSLALETKQTAGSMYVDASAAGTYSGSAGNGNAPTVNGATRGGGIQFRGGSVTHTFTATASGTFDLYMNVASENNNNITVIIAPKNDPDNPVASIPYTFLAKNSPWTTGTNYAFSNASIAVIDTKIAEGISLVKGTEYTVTVQNGNNTNIGYTDFRFVCRELAKEKAYTTVDTSYNAGLLSDAGLPYSADNGYYTDLIFIRDAGTTLTFTAAAGYVNDYAKAPAVLVYTLRNGEYTYDAEATENLTANGYSAVSGTYASCRAVGGRLVYTVTTEKNNTCLRFAAKANGKDALSLAADAYSGAVYTLTPADESRLFAESTGNTLYDEALKNKTLAVIGSADTLGHGLYHEVCTVFGMMGAKYDMTTTVYTVPAYAASDTLSIPSADIVLIFGSNADYLADSSLDAYRNGLAQVIAAAQADTSRTVVAVSAIPSDGAANAAGNTAAAYKDAFQTLMQTSGIAFFDPASDSGLDFSDAETVASCVKNGALSEVGHRRIYTAFEKFVSRALPNPDNITVSLADAALGQAVRLSDGTVLLRAVGDTTYALTFTVNVRTAGVYTLEADVNRLGGRVYAIGAASDKVNGKAFGSLDGTADYTVKNPSDEDFRVSAKKETLTLLQMYLAAGDNTVTLYCLKENDNDYPVGVSNLVFRRSAVSGEDCARIPASSLTGGTADTMTGGRVLTDGTSVTYEFTAEDTGFYNFYALLGADNTTTLSFIVTRLADNKTVGNCSVTVPAGRAFVLSDTDIGGDILLESGKTYRVTLTAGGNVTVGDLRLKKIGTPANSLTLDTVTVSLGAQADLRVRATGLSTGKVLCLAYDKADSLVGSTYAVKSEYTEELTFTVTPIESATIASVRVFMVDTDYHTASEILVCRGENSVKKIDASAFSVTKSESETFAHIPYAFAVHADEMTATSGASLLDDGETRLFRNGNTTTFTVYAEKEGAYAIDLKCNTTGGYIQYVNIRNETYAAFNKHGSAEARLGKSTKWPTATQDSDYAVSAEVRYGAFDGEAESYIWLLAGENKLNISITVNQTGTCLGLDSIAFTPSALMKADGASVVYASSEIKTANTSLTNVLGKDGPLGSSINLYQNGFFLRGSKDYPSIVYFDVTVPEDGAYDLSVLGSTEGPVITVSAESNSFLPIKKIFGKQTLGDCSTTAMPLSVGTLNLKAGTHTLKMVVSSGYFHFNLMALTRVGDYSEDETIAISPSYMLEDKDTGVFDLTMDINDCTGKTYKILVDVTGEDASGNAFTYQLTSLHENYGSVQTFSGTPQNGINTITVSAHVYEYDKGTGKIGKLVYTMKPNTYKSEETLRTFLLTDTHYTGTNALQQVKYYNGTTLKTSQRFGWTVGNQKSLKEFNYYTAEYDIYGWTSDEKLQRIMDEVIEKYKNGEFDLLFILGDQAMNDAPYVKFEINNVTYKDLLKKGNTVYNDPEGPTCADFWESPINVSNVVKKLFFDQLSANGIPYYITNGNHDYQYTYSKNKDDLDFTPWENMYHYAELLGHRTETDNGSYLRDDNDEYIHYSDSDSVNFLVRVIRRNGEVKILTPMTEAELSAFKEKYASDTNCYDFYVSEETVTDADEKLGAFVMTNGFGMDTYQYFTDVGVITINGVKNYTGQTIRYSSAALKQDMIKSMLDRTVREGYGQTFMVSHLISKSDMEMMIDGYDNVQGAFYGDVHDEEHYYATIPYWVAGHFSSAYDIDYYYADIDGDGNTEPDNQYYYDRGNPKIGNRIWGDFSRHSWNYMVLKVHGDTSYATRVHPSFFLENGTQARLTFDTVTGWDAKYVRATAPASLAAHKFYYVYKGDKTLYTEPIKDKTGARKVFVGGDTVTVGQSFSYLVEKYTKGTFMSYKYRIDAKGNVYTLSGQLLGQAEGLTLARSGVFTAMSDEGKAVTFNGATYYLVGVHGDISGHYLYDEKGDWVYVDQNDDYVFYTAVEKTSEASMQTFNATYGRDLDIPYQREWFYKNKAGELVSLESTLAESRTNGGQNIVITDIYLVTAEDVQNHAYFKQSKYYVDPAVNTASTVSSQIVIRDGKIVAGEGYCHFSYVHTLTYADGSTVTESDVRRETDANGNVIYGMYIPYMEYLGEWFNR